MAEGELLKIARAYDSLTEDAQTALRAEFAVRKLEPPLIEDEEPILPSLRRFVTLQRYRDLSEAIVARSLLESAGIPAWIRDENLGRLEWQISNFIGGLRLQVEASDGEAALALLTQALPNSIPIEGEAEFVQPCCPVCGSTQISFRGPYRGAALASLYLCSLPVPFGKEIWSCESCGTRWERSDE